MSAPVAQGTLVPWQRLTFGRIREEVLRSAFGSSDPAHASPDSALPVAEAQEIALAGQWVIEALVELQTDRELYWPLSEATVVAEAAAAAPGTYPSVLLPVDYGTFVKNGFHVDGNPVRIMTTEQYLAARVPDADGGGVNLTLVAGTPPQTPYVARIAPAEQDLDDEDANDPSAEWRMALWLYPLQTVAWSLECAYRATARNYTNDTDAIRLPTRMLRLVRLYANACAAEQNGNVEGAAKKWALYDSALSKVEGTPPSMEQQATMTLEPPLDNGGFA